MEKRISAKRKPATSNLNPISIGPGAFGSGCSKKKTNLNICCGKRDSLWCPCKGPRSSWRCCQYRWSGMGKQCLWKGEAPLLYHSTPCLSLSTNRWPVRRLSRSCRRRWCCFEPGSGWRRRIWLLHRRHGCLGTGYRDPASVATRSAAGPHLHLGWGKHLRARTQCCWATMCYWVTLYSQADCILPRIGRSALLSRIW